MSCVDGRNVKSKLLVLLAVCAMLAVAAAANMFSGDAFWGFVALGSVVVFLVYGLLGLLGGWGSDPCTCPVSPGPTVRVNPLWKPVNLSWWDRFGIPDHALRQLKSQHCGHKVAIGRIDTFHTALHFDLLCRICGNMFLVLYTDK